MTAIPLIDGFDSSAHSLDHTLPVEDAWFVAVNNQVLHARDFTWWLQVEGIHRADAHLWIQFAPMQGFPYGAVIHCLATQSVMEILGWLPNLMLAKAKEREHFIDLAPVPKVHTSSF